MKSVGPGTLPAAVLVVMDGAIRSSSCSIWNRWCFSTAILLRSGRPHSLAAYFFGPPFSLGLLFPGAWAGLPDGNWPGGKLAFDGAILSSSGSIWKRLFCSSLRGSITLPCGNWQSGNVTRGGPPRGCPSSVPCYCRSSFKTPRHRLSWLETGLHQRLDTGRTPWGPARLLSLSPRRNTAGSRSGPYAAQRTGSLPRLLARVERV